MAKYCTSCGSPIDDEVKFCPSCGAAQDAAVTRSDPTEQTVPYPPEVNPPLQGTTAAPAPKSKLVAGLLGLFLGGWGVHNFYLGNIQRGVIQIIVTIVSCGIGSLWGFIEGILILCGNINTDADGNPLAD